MIMTPDIWDFLVKVIKSSQASPSWLTNQANLDWDAVSKLPIVDATQNGQHAVPTLEEKIVTQDYLDFLREQIALNPRGPEWLDLLKSRLTAIEPFAGKQLMVATFHAKPHSATLRIHIETKSIVHMETI